MGRAKKPERPEAPQSEVKGGKGRRECQLHIKKCRETHRKVLKKKSNTPNQKNLGVLWVLFLTTQHPRKSTRKRWVGRVRDQGFRGGAGKVE